MICKHRKNLAECNSCSTTILTALHNRKKSCPCYVNALINLPESSVIKTFTSEELYSLNSCIAIPLTSTCDGTAFKLGQCQSGGWCKVIDSGNGFITSLQVPKGCDGCYNFDLSASVALTGDVSVLTPGSTPTTTQMNLPTKFTLKLTEQLPRNECVADQSEQTSSCFTSVLFPIIDTAMSSTSNLSLLEAVSRFVLFFLGTIEDVLSRDVIISNLAFSGTVCLRSCQRLVPSLSLEPIEFLSTIPIAGATFTTTNIKLSLFNMSLKLVRIGKCENDCDCKQK